MKETIAGFKGFVRCLDNAKESGIIYGTGVCEVGDIKGHSVLAQAYEMGKNI